MTKSEQLISNIRQLCHDATQQGEASPLVVAALELAQEHEEHVEISLKLESVIHDFTKELEALAKET